MYVKLTQKCDSFAKWMEMALENGHRLQQDGPSRLVVHAQDGRPHGSGTFGHV